MSLARVDFESVEKVYPGGTQALYDCSLSIADGELLVLVGPSGCGKSTLLRLLAGLEAPTRGAIRIDGRVVNDESPQSRNVAMVFQDYALYPHMTVRENLAFPLRMKRLARDDVARRVAKTAELLELGTLLDRLPRQLSGGQRQRVAMGRALVREPAAFLLDEPLSNLDAKLRGQVRAEIETLQRRTGATMLYVTHDQVEAMTLGDRVAVLHEGRLQQVAEPRALYEQPANVFVAGFVGSPPMNLFAARVATDANGRPALAVAGALLPIPDALLEAAVKHEGATLTAGVRPESLALIAPGADGALPARVEHVELLGHATLVHLRVADDLTWIARTPGMESHARGSSVALHLDPQALHLFTPRGIRLH
jgi:multiple sugar transport system ATP-binding protein